MMASSSSCRNALLATALVLLAGLAAPTLAAGPQASLAIVGGRVLTMAGHTYNPGRVLIEGGTIIAVGGEDLDLPPRCTLVDAKGAWVVPGLIDSGTSLGLMEIELEPTARDLDEEQELLGPHLRVIDALNPQSEVIPVSRLTGITTVLVCPASADLFSGQAAVFDLAGDSIDEMTVRAPAMLCLNLGSEPLARGRARSKFATRMGLAAQVREQFVSAQEYLKKQERYRRALEVYREKLRKAAASTGAATAPVVTTGSPAATAASNPPATPASPLVTASAEVGEEPEEPARDLRWEALGLALEKKLPVLVRAQREDDIRTALRLADEFKFRLVLRHGAEAWKVADLLAKRNIPVIVGPIGQQPSNFESPGARYDNAALLRKAGVTIAIQTAETHNVRNLPFAAGMAAAHGLTPEEALEAITAGAARVLGISGRYGTLEKGKVANVAIFEGEPDGDPLQPRTKLRQLFIRGKQVPLESRQTELFEKYR